VGASLWYAAAEGVNMPSNDTRSFLQYLRDAIPGGAVDQVRSQVVAQNLHDPEKARLMGDQILTYTLGGLGLGLSGTKLYNMISDINRQKPKYTKFGPGSKTIDADEKVAGNLSDGLANIYNTVVSAPGKLIQNISDDRATREGLLMSATTLGTVGGLYGGHKLMDSLINKKRKDDLQAEVEDAKKEYLRALLSKKYAAALDTAFNKLVKTASPPVSVSNLLAPIKWPFDAARVALGDDVYKMYILGALSTGALSGKLTYDWTRARSRDKAIADAQKTRARLSGMQPLYIDPEQMTALKKITTNN
jgi:hypothetical protein